MTDLSAREMAALAELIAHSSGICLDASKRYLVLGRLGPLLAAVGCRSFAQLVDRARADDGLAQRVVDAVTTPETSFFRDPRAFALIAEVLLPEWQAAGRRRLRIWCAACATGQEAYSLVILLREHLSTPRAPAARLLASDISTAALERAAAGRYRRRELERGLSAARGRRWFQALPGGWWRVQESLRQGIEFRRLNLLDLPASLGRFDLILCRNVAIYFAAAQRARLYTALAGHLQPWGTLVLGATERVPPGDHGLEVRSAAPVTCYRRADGPR